MMWYRSLYQERFCFSKELAFRWAPEWPEVFRATRVRSRPPKSPFVCGIFFFWESVWSASRPVERASERARRIDRVCLWRTKQTSTHTAAITHDWLHFGMHARNDSTYYIYVHNSTYHTLLYISTSIYILAQSSDFFFLFSDGDKMSAMISAVLKTKITTNTYIYIYVCKKKSRLDWRRTSRSLCMTYCCFNHRTVRCSPPLGYQALLHSS